MIQWQSLQNEMMIDYWVSSGGIIDVAVSLPPYGPLRCTSHGQSGRIFILCSF